MSERAARAKKRDAKKRGAARSAPAAQEAAPVAHAAQRTPVQRPVAAAADADTVGAKRARKEKKGNSGCAGAGNKRARKKKKRGENAARARAALSSQQPSQGTTQEEARPSQGTTPEEAGSGDANAGRAKERVVSLRAGA